MPQSEAFPGVSGLLSRISTCEAVPADKVHADAVSLESLGAPAWDELKRLLHNAVRVYVESKLACASRAQAEWRAFQAELIMVAVLDDGRFPGRKEAPACLRARLRERLLAFLAAASPADRVLAAFLARGQELVRGEAERLSLAGALAWYRQGADRDLEEALEESLSVLEGRAPGQALVHVQPNPAPPPVRPPTPPEEELQRQLWSWLVTAPPEIRGPVGTQLEALAQLVAAFNQTARADGSLGTHRYYVVVARPELLMACEAAADAQAGNLSSKVIHHLRPDEELTVWRSKNTSFVSQDREASPFFLDLATQAAVHPLASLCICRVMSIQGVLPERVESDLSRFQACLRTDDLLLFEPHRLRLRRL